MLVYRWSGAVEMLMFRWSWTVRDARVQEVRGS